jgi:hypothetical protein
MNEMLHSLLQIEDIYILKCPVKANSPHLACNTVILYCLVLF